MSSTDRMRDASLIRSEILQKISLRPYHFRQLLDTKSSSSMRRITQQTTYNSYLGRLQRSFLATADLSSPAISKIKSLNPFTVRCACIDFSTNSKDRPKLASQFFNRLGTILETESIEADPKVSMNSSTNTSQTGEESSTNVNDIPPQDK